MRNAATSKNGLDPYQVKALLEAASESRFEPLYVVAIHTGLRRGELLGITLDTYSHVLPGMGDQTATAIEDALS